MSVSGDLVYVSPDEAYLRMLSGTVVTFDVELPSGRVMSAPEVQVWADLYDECYQRGNEV